MFRKFVFYTGALDFLLALGVVYKTMSNPVVGAFIPWMAIAGFLIVAGALLIWASKDLVARAPVIFWLGFVRVFAVCTIIYAYPNGLAVTADLPFVPFDAIIGLAYIVGILRHSKNSLPDFLLLRAV